jgi:hypothetical protein
VNLPETVELRRRLLPDGPRQSSHCGSALDLTWVESIDSADAILVTAQGLVPYFQRGQVHMLVAALSARHLFVFDVVPASMLNLVRRASGRKRDLATELWTWLLDRQERAAVSAIPRGAELRDLLPPVTPSVASLGIAVVSWLPMRLRSSSRSWKRGSAQSPRNDAMAERSNVARHSRDARQLDS